MYKFNRLFFIITIFIGCLAGAAMVSAAAKPVVHQIKVEVGKNVTITLPDYFDGGISWKFITRPNKKITSFVKAYAVAPTSTVTTSLMVGGVGTYNYVFKGLKAGVTNLKLHAIRPWDKKSPIYDSYVAKITVVIPPKPVKCGTNATCANKLVKNCAKGSFTQGAVKPDIFYTVKGKNLTGTCDIEWGYVGAKYPLTGLKMICSVPNTVQTFKQFGNYISNKNNHFSNCTGTLKDSFNTPISQIPPEPIAAKNVCTDAACANRILSTCTHGNFSVTKIRDNDTVKTVFTIDSTQFYKEVCETEVKITESSDKNLIGPTMRCVLRRDKIKTLVDAGNFITDKFDSNEANGFSSCVGDLYQKVKNTGVLW